MKKPLIRIQPDIDKGNPEPHKSPVTRRDFLGRGLMAGATYMSLPSIFGMLEMRKAYGAISCTNLNLAMGMYGEVLPASFMAYECAGGVGFTSMILPRDIMGIPISNSTRLGFDTVSNSTQHTTITAGVADGTYDDNLIKGLRLRVQDRFYSTLRGLTNPTQNNSNDATPEIDQTVADEALACLSGSMAYAQMNDDSSENPLTAAPLIRGLTSGLFMGTVIGRERSKLPMNSALYSVLEARNINDLQGSVRMAEALYNEKRMGMLGKAVRSLASSQAQNLGRRAFGSQLVEQLSLRSSEAEVYGAPCLATLFNPVVTGTTNLFEGKITGVNNAGVQFDYATISAVAQRFSPCATVVRGGYDYHGNNIDNNVQPKHREIALFVKRWAVTHYLLAKENQASGGTKYPTAAKKAMLVLYTDGGIGWQKADADERFQPVSDRGAVSPYIMLFFDYDKATTASRHIGGVTTAETASAKHLVGTTPHMPAASAAANFARFVDAGGGTAAQSAIARILGDAPFRLSLAQIQELLALT